MAKPYAERMFAYHELDRLSDAEARTALVAPAGQHDVQYGPEAAQLIVKASSGYPHFIQEYGRVLWNEVERSPITASDVEGARALQPTERDSYVPTSASKANWRSKAAAMLSFCKQ